MKTLLFVLLACLIHHPVFSQQANKRINVARDIELIQLSEHAWVHLSWAEVSGYGRVPSNGLILTNRHEAFMFDTPMSDSLTRELVAWMKDSMKVKIVGFVPNHWHADCIGGLGYLKTLGIPSYANQKTIELARSNHRPVPDHGFKDSLQLRLGDQRIECYYLGAAHSLDNIVVWIPAEKILFAGCMVKSMDANNLGNTADGDLNAYPTTINLLLQKFPTAKIVIPGHGDFGGKELIDHTISLCNRLTVRP